MTTKNKHMFMVFKVEAERTCLTSGKPHSVESGHRGNVVSHNILNDGMFSGGENIRFRLTVSKSKIDANL